MILTLHEQMSLLCCKSVNTPMETRTTSKDDEPLDDPFHHQRVVGKLIYLIIIITSIMLTTGVRI